jgi:hypothetical protein
MRLRILLAAAALAGLGALAASVACSPDEFVCHADRECVGGKGEFGLCLTSHCAFKDPGCTGGYRWDDSAGSQRNSCADPATVQGHLDAGVSGSDAAPAPDAGSADAASAADAP